MQLHFQAVRRDLQTLDALVLRYRLAIIVGVEHHHGDTVAQYGTIDNIGLQRFPFLRSACFLPGSRVKVTGVGQLGILLQSHVVPARRGNSHAVAVNGGMVLLVLLVALHPHADSGLQSLPIAHGKHIDPQGGVKKVALSHADFLIATHCLDRFAVLGFRQNVALEAVRLCNGCLAGIRVQFNLHPDSDLFRARNVLCLAA